MRRGKILNDVGRGFVKAGKAAKTGAYYTGRGALAAATLGLSEKRARNAYYKAGKSIPTAAKYAGRALTLGMSKKASNAYKIRSNALELEKQQKRAVNESKPEQDIA